MTQQKRVNRIPGGVVAGITAAVVVAGGSAAWWTLNSQPPIKPSPPETTKPSPSQQTAQTYWLKSADKQFELVPVPNPQTASDQPTYSPLETAFNRLLAGPPDQALSSTIPKGTKLRSVKIEPDGVHVDLSQEFTTGGGSTSMTGRVAQVLYTATSLRPDTKVWINVEGKPLEYLGGEGLELEQPLTRQSFEHNFTL